MLWVQILHKNSGSTSPLLFWAFINKTLHFRPFGYYYYSCSLDLGLGKFGPHFFKEGAPLAPGPTFRPWVEFWVQLPYPQRFSSRSNQSHYDTWRDTKNHPSHYLTWDGYSLRAYLTFAVYIIWRNMFFNMAIFAIAKSGELS